MGVINCIASAILASQILLDDYLFKCKHRLKPEYFTRKCKMNFKDVVLFGLNMAKKTLQVELNSFFETVLQKDYSITKQAYSESRQKIDPGVFIDLNDRINKVIYEEYSEYELWNGYRISAIDGSVLALPNTELLRNEFGYVENQTVKLARAKASCVFDVINKIVIKSKIDKYTTSERDMAKILVSEMIKDGARRELILFDRGYPSSEFISFLVENKVDYMIRASTTFSNVIIKAKKPDQIVKIYQNSKAYSVRVIRFILDSGIEEILLTSLYDKTLTIDDFKKLYFKRWGIEVKFDELKNRLEIDNFSGTTKIAIEQDFYATIYLANMAELARKESDKKVTDKNSEKELKYGYKTNLNILIGSLKDKFVQILLINSSRKQNKMFKKLIDQVSKSVVPIKPDRQNVRRIKLIKSKNNTNHKRCL
jgi:hypothetical protein